MSDESEPHNPEPESEEPSAEPRQPQQDMFSGGVPSSVAADIVGRRSVQLKSYKSLERRLARLEKIIWWWGTMIVTGLIGIIIKLTIINGGI